MKTKMELVLEPDPMAPPGTFSDGVWKPGPVRMRTTFQPRIHVYPLEDTIVEAFRDTMPVVALGKPGETHGVARILVDDENWQSAASELMPRALLLICVPSSRPESQWELNQSNTVPKQYLSCLHQTGSSSGRTGIWQSNNYPLMVLQSQSTTQRGYYFLLTQRVSASPKSCFWTLRKNCKRQSHG